MPFLEDEAIRSIVALEMLYKNEFLVPTINEKVYLFKPPLYNWILAIVFYLSGIVNEWTARLPNIVFLLLFSLSIYRFSRRYFSKETSALNAFLFLSCGRILFWESFLSLIDIFYSWVTYSAMMFIFIYKDQRLKMFAIVYFLSAIGYLLKGFPSIVFLGLSLFILFFYWKKLRALFCWEHLIGIGIAAGMVGLYYYGFNQRYDYSASFAPLLSQATQRTIINHSIQETIIHIFVYPFENVYHFLPWSLLGIMAFDKRSWSIAKANPFVVISALLFLNIAVYWVSVEVYPRYILMLAPLYFTVFLYLYRHELLADSIFKKIIDYAFIVLMASIAIAPLVALFIPQLAVIENIKLKMIGLSVFSLANFYLFTKHKKILWALLHATLILRIFFNFVFIELRTIDKYATKCRAAAIEVAKTYGAGGIKLYKNSRMDKISSFYLASTTKKQNKRYAEFEKDAYYIIDQHTETFDPKEFTVIDSFPIVEWNRQVHIIQKK